MQRVWDEVRNMKRNYVLKLLAEYVAVSHQEEKVKYDIERFIKEYSDCFERSLTIGHITASAWLVNHDFSKFFLMHHKKLNIWVQPGGHCDGNPNVLEVAVKEAQEESGIANIVPVSEKIFDLDIHQIPANKKEAAHYHYDVRFLLQAKDADDSLVKNDESYDIRWFNAADLDSLQPKEESVIRMARKFLKFESY